MEFAFRADGYEARFVYPVISVTGPGLDRPVEYLARFSDDEGFEPLGNQLANAIRYTRHWA